MAPALLRQSRTCAITLALREETCPKRTSEWPPTLLVSADTTTSAPVPAAAGRVATSWCCRRRRAHWRRARGRHAFDVGQVESRVRWRLDPDQAVTRHISLLQRGGGDGVDQHAKAGEELLRQGAGDVIAVGWKQHPVATFQLRIEDRSHGGHAGREDDCFCVLECRQRLFERVPGRVGPASVLVRPGGITRQVVDAGGDDRRGKADRRACTRLRRDATRTRTASRGRWRAYGVGTCRGTSTSSDAIRATSAEAGAD